MPRYDVLSEEAVARVDAAWKRIVSEIGLTVAHPDALAALEEAGQKAVDGVVRFDPDFVCEQIAKAPAEFTLHARDPEKSIRIGGDAMVTATVGGPAFVRSGAVRHDGTAEDCRRFLKLSQHFDVIDIPGAGVAPADLPLETRHLDLLLDSFLLTTKPSAAFGGAPAIEDALAMASIVFGSREKVTAEPVMYSVANCNSPLEWDTRMLDAMLDLGRARQPVIVTPFLLMGAMAPVSIPAALAQQLAEAFTGIAIMQLVSPGTPAVLGSFLSHTDMQSGAPGFGGPEAALGLLCSGQLARHYGLPWRAGGGSLTSSNVPDAQAAYEGLNTLLPAFLAGANVVYQAAGWLESGLVASYEKFAIDVELLQMLEAQFTPVEFDEESFAFDAHVEVAQGSHFFGAAHTLERYRTCFYRPILSSTENNERWTRMGEKDTAVRAAELVEKALDEYERPPIDEAVEAELRDYVERRRSEITAAV